MEEASEHIANFFYRRIRRQAVCGVVDACLNGVGSGMLVRSDGVDREGEIKDDPPSPILLWHNSHGGDLEGARSELLDFFPCEDLRESGVDLVLDVLRDRCCVLWVECTAMWPSGDSLFNDMPFPVGSAVDWHSISSPLLERGVERVTSGSLLGLHEASSRTFRLGHG